MPAETKGKSCSCVDAAARRLPAGPVQAEGDNDGQDGGDDDLCRNRSQLNDGNAQRGGQYARNYQGYYYLP